MTDYFVLKYLVIMNIVPKSVDTCREPAFIDFGAFKWPTEYAQKTGIYP